MPENPIVKHAEAARPTIMPDLGCNRRQYGNRDAHRRRLPDGSTLKKGSSLHEHHYSLSFACSDKHLFLTTGESDIEHYVAFTFRFTLTTSQRASILGLPHTFLSA